MNPHDFLSLAASHDFEQDSPHSKNQLTSTEWHKQQIATKNPLPIPMLTIDMKNSIGKISGHEGRHRAKASIDMGLNEIPVILRIYGHVPFKDKNGYIDYSKINALVSTKKLTEQMIQDIGEAQRTADIPTFCSQDADELECKIRPEPMYDKNWKVITKPVKKINIQFTNFKPLCQEK